MNRQSCINACQDTPYSVNRYRTSPRINRTLAYSLRRITHVKFIFTSKIASGIFLAASLLAQNSKLAPDLAILDPNEPVDVIIQLNDPPPGRPGAPRPARPLALGGVNLASQRPVRELGLINGLAARLPAASLASLAADPRVR